VCNRPAGARIQSRKAEFRHSLQETEVAMDPATIILPALFAAIAFSIHTVAASRARVRLLETHAQESLVDSILRGEERRSRQSALRWGIVLVFLSLGFAIVELSGWDRPSPGVLAVLLGATGLGNIVSYLVCRKVDQRD
jgi:hypothetical protein